MRGSLSEWGGPGSGKWKLRVYAGRDGRNRPTYLSRNCTGTRRQAESALSQLVADWSCPGPTDRLIMPRLGGGAVGSAVRIRRV
jgi:hypothetical protein